MFNTLNVTEIQYNESLKKVLHLLCSFLNGVAGNEDIFEARGCAAIL